MEILIGALVVIAGRLVKKLADKFDIEVARAGTLLIVFVLSAAAALVYYFVDQSFWQQLGKIFAIQMVIYEVVYKTILKPVFDK